MTPQAKLADCVCYCRETPTIAMTFSTSGGFYKSRPPRFVIHKFYVLHHHNTGQGRRTGNSKSLSIVNRRRIPLPSAAATSDASRDWSDGCGGSVRTEGDMDRLTPVPSPFSVQALSHELYVPNH